jgi:ATP-dependent exoDNAse (exonuclease V) alpha subunit
VKQARSQEFLNDAQRQVIEEVLNSTDRVHGLQGRAGTGKTSVLVSIREGAEKSGYTIEGFAPTSRAAAQLREAGIDATTLQSFLARGENRPGVEPELRHLYMLDESSLASTRQMRAFLEKLKPQDRVLVIGDTSQHQAVGGGRPFEQMQQAGMRTSQLDQIMRQKNPELRRAVELLAANDTEKGFFITFGEEPRCFVPLSTKKVTVRFSFQLPTSSTPIMIPSSISVSLDKPLQIMVLPGGGS